MLEENVGFHNGTVGIASPPDDSVYLGLVEAYLNSSLAHYYQYLTCSTWGVERAVIEENEIMSTPFAVPDRDIVSEILRVTGQVRDDPQLYGALLGDLDALVFAAYELNSDDVDRVYDTLTQLRLAPDDSVPVRPTDATARVYAETLEASLRPVIRDVTIEVSAPSIFPHYLVSTVHLSQERGGKESGHEAPWDLLATDFEDAIERSPSPVTIIQPSLIILHEQAAYLVKPDEWRYWTASRAREDAGEILGAVLAVAKS